MSTQAQPDGVDWVAVVNAEKERRDMVAVLAEQLRAASSSVPPSRNEALLWLEQHRAAYLGAKRELEEQEREERQKGSAEWRAAYDRNADTQRRARLATAVAARENESSAGGKPPGSGGGGGDGSPWARVLALVEEPDESQPRASQARASQPRASQATHATLTRAAAYHATLRRALQTEHERTVGAPAS